MRFLFTSHPLDGHVRPLIRYATALRDAGHDVRVAAQERGRALIEKHDLDFVCLPEAPEDEVARAMALLDASKGRDGVTVGMQELFGGVLARALLPRLEAEITAWKPDLVVHEATEFAGRVAAEKYGVPCVSVAILATGCIAEYAVELDETHRLLRRFAGLNEPPPAEAEPVLTAFPAGFDGEASILGAEPIRIGQSEPPTLPVDGDEAWLPEPGEMLVYLTLGTAAGRTDKSRAAYHMALDVLADLPVKVLLTLGPTMDPALLEPFPENVVVETFVPQTKVFSVASAIVHHGGSGTTLGALAAAVPQVIMPLFADQPFNAQALAASGVGLAVEHDDPDALRRAVETVLADVEIHARCVTIAEEMAGMPGVSFAVETLEQLAR